MRLAERAWASQTHSPVPWWPSVWSRSPNRTCWLHNGARHESCVVCPGVHGLCTHQMHSLLTSMLETWGSATKPRPQHSAKDLGTEKHPLGPGRMSRALGGDLGYALPREVVKACAIFPAVCPPWVKGEQRHCTPRPSRLLGRGKDS